MRSHENVSIEVDSGVMNDRNKRQRCVSGCIASGWLTLTAQSFGLDLSCSHSTVSAVQMDRCQHQTDDKTRRFACQQQIDVDEVDVVAWTAASQQSKNRTELNAGVLVVPLCLAATHVFCCVFFQ